MRPPTFGSKTIRPLLMRVLAIVGLSLLAAVASGCGNQPTPVAVQQPIAFPHRHHVSYFSSGQHRQEKIRMHLDMFGQTEPPPELAEGRCVECHDDLQSKTACAGCHTLFQDAALRSRKAIRPCTGCHRGTWTGDVATLPRAELCVACHGAADVLAMRRGEKLGPVRLARLDDPRSGAVGAEDLPWVQINTVPPNVYFSHSAHVRYKSIACTRCHDDVSGLGAPPASVRAMSMGECLRCHADNGASTDCLTCHK